MAIPVWRMRPSPSRLRFLILFIVLVPLLYILLPLGTDSAPPWWGPQKGNEQYFQLKGKQLFIPKDEPELSEEDLYNIRDRLFSTDDFWNFNYERFPATEIAILIQVHNRPQFFKVLIDSLRLAENIQQVELIISHDIWSEEMVNLTASIDFCRVTQIFFPLSASFYKNRFPADDVDICVRNAHVENCKGEPDTYGNYRESHIVNIKHHWWWKLNYAAKFFPHIESFIFLEEDHALMPDFIEVLHKMKSFAEAKNPETKPVIPFILTLGTYKSKMTKNTDDWQTIISSSFDSGKHNMAMILNRRFIENLRSPPMVKIFCDYDDYNWDFSLFDAIQDHFKVLRVFMPQIPHVFHLGDKCGLHHKIGDCSASNVKIYKQMLKDHRYYFFPPSFQTLRRAHEAKKKLLKPNGGWGDHRDRQLCHYLVNNVKPSSLQLHEIAFLIN